MVFPRVQLRESATEVGQILEELIISPQPERDLESSGGANDSWRALLAEARSHDVPSHAVVYEFVLSLWDQ